LPQAERLIRKLQWYRHLGLKIVGVYLFEEGAAVDEVADVDVLRHRRSILDLIARGSIDQIFVTLSLEQATKVREIQEWLGDDPVTLYFVPDIGEFVRLRGAIEEFDDLHIITLQDSPLEGWNSVLKRAMDLLIGMMALILFSPLMVLIAIGVWLTSHGPILYRQERMGLDGRRFEMLKFRTMVEDAEKLTGPIWATANDPRLTALGRWLRRTSLDELPQLINVLRGEMSLVGPRPERPALIEQFRRDIPKYMLRHKVKAGMTGWAQINGWRGSTSLEKRIELDIFYIENWSLWRDLRILSLTLFRGFLNKNAG
jgi:Undecaprenyl-phosphate glucose phosphotransferase